jgi:multidrug efflux pump subunit AcrA (membrane-fusion protein)
MSKLNERPWLNLVLGLLCIGAIAVAYATVGQASQGSAQSRTAIVQKGVVQSTVSGSGNIQAASQLNLGFKTSGTVTHIYVTQGQHVTKGQLVAALNPQSAEVTLEQAKASLQSAEANLAKEEESEGETSSEQTSGGASTGGTSTGATTSGSSSSSTSGASSATRAANLASAKAAVKSDGLTVQSDEQAVQDTKLYAPENGTIVKLSGEVGETVTATGTTKASATTSSSSASSSTGAAGGSSTGAAGGASSQSASTESSSSSGGSSSFAVLSNLSSLQLVVPLSESEIGNVRVGQTATVTIEALSGRKVAAHVLSVDTLSTSNSGVVSYDVTFQLDQPESGLKPGMSATAEVVVKQAEGLNVPTTAISAGSVTVVRNGKRVSQSVTPGLAGDNSTIILSGLNAGEEIVLPSAASSTSSSKAGASSRLGGRLGSGGLGGGLGGGGGAIPGGGRPGG